MLQGFFGSKNNPETGCHMNANKGRPQSADGWVFRQWRIFPVPGGSRQFHNDTCCVVALKGK
jgi:hypothetical protein